MVKSQNQRPRDRLNIILSRNHSVEESQDTKCFQSLKLAFEFCNELKGDIRNWWIANFNECCKEEFYTDLNKIYLTRFNDEYHPRDTIQFSVKIIE